MLKPTQLNQTKGKYQNSKFYTISAAVYKVLEDLQYGEERFNQFLNFAIDGAKRLNLNVKTEIHFGEFDMTPWKTLVWPDDMISWNVLGIRVGNGIKVFVRDRNIPKFRDLIDCVPQENKPVPRIDLVEVGPLIPFLGYNNYFSSYGTHYYGALVRRDYEGYFDVDEKNRLFNFKEVIPQGKKIYLEWIGDGLNYNGQTIIHPTVFPCLVDFIHWQRVKFDGNYGLGEIRMFKDDFDQSVDEALVNNLDMSVDEVRNALSYGYTQTVNGI